MSESNGTGSTVNGSTGADDKELSALIETVTNDHGDEGAASMADHLRDRVDETRTEPEDHGDVED